MSLRAIPNFNVYRPADAKETASCIKLALKDKNTPSALLLTRQGVPVLEKIKSKLMQMYLKVRIQFLNVMVCLK